MNQPNRFVPETSYFEKGEELYKLHSQLIKARTALEMAIAEFKEMGVPDNDEKMQMYKEALSTDNN
jgi:hypothetical protein